MFSVVRACGGGRYAVLDSSDGVEEEFSFGEIARYIMSGVEVSGVVRDGNYYWFEADCAVHYYSWKVLVACEESQRVCIELRKRRHEAYSCDVQECSGGHPEWHICGDVLPLLDGCCSFATQDGVSHTVDTFWDMVIAFPPCTHLSLSGARSFEEKRADGRQREGIEFFCQFLFAKSPRVAIENPRNIMHGGWYLRDWFPDLCEKYGVPRDCTQVIQPYWFGENAEKQTCLWLKGLPPLTPTDIVDKGGRQYSASGKSYPEWMLAHGVSKAERGKFRSKTFIGVARAMADQWAGGW